MPGMAQALTFIRARLAQPAELLRSVAVIGCGLALIAAGPAYPSLGL